MADVVLVDVSDGIATVTLNRPESRNALSSELLRALPRALRECNDDDAVSVIILTGSDPAFCAGLDLRELGSAEGQIRPDRTGPAEGGDVVTNSPWPPLTKPVIGAINGAAVTGGFELALNCDFLIASERARFGDTHTRVGIMPGWGLSVLLPEAIGIRRAKEMSLTGNFMSASEAYDFGLVNRVVPHEELLPTARQLAADIAGNDQESVRELLRSYKLVAGTTVDEGMRIEQETARGWQGRRFDPAEVERRRQAIIERGRSQT
jgi:enoyl-CoA hydratase